MGRFATYSFDSVAVTTAVDCFEIAASSGKPFILHEVVIGQSSDYGDAAAEGLNVRIKKGIGYTSGSGGSTATAAKHATNDAAVGPTAETNNTTQASAGGGSLTTIRPEPHNVQAGYQYLPTPEQRITFLPAEALVVSLAAPADSLTLSGLVLIEEL